MLAENVLTSNPSLHQRLREESLTVEMADSHEAIVRDNNTDTLFLVLVDRLDDDTLELACECVDGAKEIACTHALRALRHVRANEELLAAALRKPIEEWRDQTNNGRHLVQADATKRPFSKIG